MITIKNYQDNKNSVNWSKMPKALQDTRNDVEEIMEFYDDDADIKETVDIFLKQINDNSKPVGEIIVGKLPKIKFVEPKKIDRAKIDKFKAENPLEIKDLKPKVEKFKIGDIVKSKIDNSDKNLYEIYHINKVNSVKAKILNDDSSKEYIFFEDEIVRIESAKKEIKSQPTKKVQAVVEKRYLDNYSTEFQLIKRFWNVIKDKKIVLEFRKAQLLYAAFNKAAVERKVRKTSEAAEIFNACNQRMKKLFEEFMLPTQSDVKVDFDNATLYNKIQDYVANVTIDPTVGMLKRFISLQNTLPEIKKAETFLKSLQRTKEKYPDSRLSKELSDAIKALQDYIKNPKEPIEVESYGLSKPKVKPAVMKKKKGSPQRKK